jgi:hypothetical protein
MPSRRTDAIFRTFTFPFNADPHASPCCCIIAAAGRPHRLFAQKTYSFTSFRVIRSRPASTRLENGLQVWLSRNADAPRIQTNIAVRAGSKNDPSDATGLAHYLEHMLFKGHQPHRHHRLGQRERVVLKQISDAYEERRRTTDDAQRDRIYQRIDSLSTLAAALAVPNEYDKMIKSIGARGTNAYTSTERTVYINDIPSDELEKWMAHRERAHAGVPCSASSTPNWRPCTRSSTVRRTTMAAPPTRR